jgi:hypothetical protein
MFTCLPYISNLLIIKLLASPLLHTNLNLINRIYIGLAKLLMILFEGNIFKKNVNKLIARNYPRIREKPLIATKSHCLLY